MPPNQLSWTAALLLVAAAFTLGQALQVNDGFFHGRAILWLFASLVLMAGACRGARTRISLASPSVVRFTLTAVVLFQVAQLLSDPPLLYSGLRHGRDDGVLAGALGATGALAVVIAFGSTRLRSIAFATILGLHLVAGTRVIQLVPDPKIDVITVQEAAIEALAAGKSPYGMTFSNIYGSDTRFYGEGMASDGQVHFGFPYPPLALLFVAPAQWLFGDLRYAAVAALAAVGGLLASFGWTRHAMLSATVLLTTPRILFEIEQGWTEPFVILMLVLMTVALRRGGRYAALATGLGMAVKQYLAVALLIAPVMGPRPARPAWRTVAIAIAVASAVTLPFVIWDAAGFVKSVMTLQFKEPFRLDSLSFLVWMARRGLHPPTTAVTLAALAAATFAVRRTLPQCPAGFAAGMAIVSIAAFAFGKKAFCNYYFFVIGALMTAVAATGAEDRSDRNASRRAWQ